MLPSSDLTWSLTCFNLFFYLFKVMEEEQLLELVYVLGSGQQLIIINYTKTLKEESGEEMLIGD